MSEALIDYHSSKTEEKNLLDLFVRQAGCDTYLSAFVNQDAVRWFGHQVDGDLTCDLHAHMVAETQRADQANEGLKKAKWQLESMETMMEDLRSHLAAVADEKAEFGKKIGELNVSLDEVYLKWNKAIDEKAEIARQLHEARQMVLELKAAAYDQMMT